MKIYKLAGKPDRCNAVLEYMIKCKMSVDRETYLPVVSSYGSAGDYAQASRLFEESRELKGRNKRPQLYSAMIGACANARDGSKWMEAIGLFEEMRQNDILITASNHNAVIGALVKGERYAAAKEWYKQLEPMQKTRVVFSIMSKASMETDDLDLARSILKEATGHADEAFKKAVAARVLMNYPITDVYNAVLSIYLNRRDIDKAMGLFEKMNTHKYKSTATPNSQTYSILLVYSANELLWDDLISAAQMARANFSYILPYAYKHAVSACKEHHRDDLVIKLDLEMHKMSADARERRRRDQLQSSR
ncbi:hypothetical protein SARC_13127 [Sphaeroforma arctica JP610]|uniref:Pentacotripeptide-repeat region of PRORP domain-containing protein n=1 Tax=Sphaeroforma arctica JP610 TaxID=667725 RepID=A0A0L0FE30_9EUKA|nr:hypothetical protein SARC_13127 [Sphaeroforma arctica JP610]KNC74323.1 hypothetical protein SARC_13127 [Sphaeroforma arctica JP610]|eukprot:XP_014148225.1 hypothetical protein SARC_13127 [Sphaeroforma arctica JP610]